MAQRLESGPKWQDARVGPTGKCEGLVKGYAGLKGMYVGGGQMQRYVWSTCKDLYGVNAEICVGWSQIMQNTCTGMFGGCRFYGACCVMAEAGAHI